MCEFVIHTNFFSVVVLLYLADANRALRLFALPGHGIVLVECQWYTVECIIGTSHFVIWMISCS